MERQAEVEGLIDYVLFEPMRKVMLSDVRLHSVWNHQKINNIVSETIECLRARSLCYTDDS